MKPKEFDELIRQKFDQGDFEYNPRNWERLEDQLDGQKKKSSLVLWWWMPLAGIAASVAFAMGVATMNTLPRIQPPIPMSQVQHTKPAATGSGNAQTANPGGDPGVASASAHPAAAKIRRHKKNHAKPVEIADENEYAISYRNAVGADKAADAKMFNFMSQAAQKADKKKKQTESAELAAKTFKEEVMAKPAKTTILLAGGVSRGDFSGYMAGGTVRHMLSGNLFLETDLNYTNSSISQTISYSNVVEIAAAQSGARQSNVLSSGVLSSGQQQAVAPSGPGQSEPVPSGAGPSASRHAASRQSAARTTSTQSQSAAKVDGNGSGSSQNEPQYETIVKNENVSYSLGYAQVSPALGYKVLGKLSVGLGPDFQNMIVDNRPEASTGQRTVVQTDPVFDMGLMGRSEYSVTKNLKASMSYRKGINNLLTASDRYVDRNYVEFLVRWAIFNR